MVARLSHHFLRLEILPAAVASSAYQICFRLGLSSVMASIKGLVARAGVHQGSGCEGVKRHCQGVPLRRTLL